jgi:plasmid rolling circle replication initiator protein Rep
MTKKECQEERDGILVDLSKTGKRREWHVHKFNSVYIAMAYSEVDVRKAARMKDCARYLRFVKQEDGTKKLHDAHFCRVRLCPMCQWRRSIKCYCQMSKVIDYLAEKGYLFIFLTLTMRNCGPEVLSDTITHLLEAFNRLTKYKRFNEAIKGYYRGCEVTHSTKDNTFHPHLHTILAVRPGYFKHKEYISHDEWQELWKKALHVSYNPSVDIRRCRGGAKAIAEACKYSVKASDIINVDDWEITVDTLRVLDSALERRRFIGLGGVMRDAHKILNLDDVEDGDLTVLDTPEDSIPADVVTYFWDGYSQYRL